MSDYANVDCATGRKMGCQTYYCRLLVRLAEFVIAQFEASEVLIIRNPDYEIEFLRGEPPAF